MAIHAIVMAAGQGTRMRSDLAKVLHTAAGRTLLDWSLAALADLDLESIAVVVGHQAPAVTAAIADSELAPLVATAIQAEQLGTGHAAGIGLAALEAAPDDVIIVMPGDMPLLRPATLVALVNEHSDSGAAATLLSAVLADPTGYGRIKRDGARVVAIVEQADATEEEAAIDEVNTSVYAFEAQALRTNIARLTVDNAQGEQYLTDVVGMLSAAGESVAALVIDAEEATGVNTVDQLEAAATVLVARAEY
ncbi:MAG: NTP transferase domain-containing protein [Acidimicrobiia bacterium]|nr:NTP transferase domain-containing protein [Acidimicrobiia bacterium]